MKWLLLYAIWVGLGGCAPTPIGIQRSYAKRLTPKQMIAPSTSGSAATARVLTVRVYADDDFRAHVSSWKERVLGLFDAINPLLERKFRFVVRVESQHSWTRQSGSGAQLTPMLTELEQLEPGEDVDWVVGFVSPLPVFSASIHDLGRARPLGKHLVLRGMNDPIEAQAIAASLDLLYDDERAELLRARRVHKEQTVLLHELGHLLGALHVAGDECLMSPMYGIHAAEFCGPNEEVIGLGLQHHVRRPTSENVRAWSSALLALLDKKGWPQIHAQERTETRDVLMRLVEVTPSPASPSPLSGEKEWAELSPRLDNGSASAEDWVKACFLSSMVARLNDRAAHVCERAVALGGDGRAYLALGQAQALVLKKVEAARHTLLEAQKRFREEKTPNPAAWRMVAELCRATRQPTLAERAAGASGDSQLVKEIHAWAQRQRRSLGLGHASNADIQTEGELSDLLQMAQKNVDGGRIGQARKQVAELKRRFPTASGPWTVSCGISFSEGNVKKAEDECSAALERYEEDVAANYILAHIYSQSRRHTQSAERFRRVIELEPDHREAYEFLAAQYRRSGNDLALPGLNESYEKRFRRRLSAQNLP
jgi:tetratricopeptide (TPR) repeat protein